ncbi:MAG: DUF4340 domain-containing protein [gamma proteobacterium symbiont of Taylorina sp.]|nr:DUF4340 domain-containing protein [gamma proteobacterium symbiont of Taylorina sp.]
MPLTQKISNLSKEVKTNLVLFIACLFLFFIAWFQPGLKQENRQYFTSMKADEISSITIKRQGIDQVKLIKKAGEWFLVEHDQLKIDLPANILRVNTITALAEKRSYSQFQVKGTDLERYHLDDPQVSIWLNNEHFIIGGTDPVNNQRYAMQLGDPSNTIHMINGTVFYQLRANINTFISTKILPPHASIQSIHWDNKILELSNGKWSFASEDSVVGTDDSVIAEGSVIEKASKITSADIIQIVQFWQKAQASRIETAVVEQVKSDNVPDKNMEITIHLNYPGKNNQQIHFLVIKEKNQIKLLRRDAQTAYLITPETLKQLTEFIF